MSTNRSKSRKKSPWDDLSDITVIQEYLQMHYVARYEQRHPKIKDSGEAELINSFQPNKCPFAKQRTLLKSDLMPTEFVDTSANVEKLLRPQRELYSTPAEYRYVSG